MHVQILGEDSLSGTNSPLKGVARKISAKVRVAAGRRLHRRTPGLDAGIFKSTASAGAGQFRKRIAARIGVNPKLLTKAIKNATILNGYVFGDDIAYGGSWDFLGTAVKSLGNLAKTDTAKTVIGTSLAVIGERMTPTQKAQLQAVQNAAGIQGVPYNAVSNTSVPFPTTKFKEATPYIIIGGAVLFGLGLLLVTKKRKTAPVAATA